MRDGEWTLSHSEGSITFGLTDSEAAFIEAPDLGDYAIENADATRPRGDGINYGVDFHGGRTITIELAIARPSVAETLAAVESFAALWRADKVRSTPGATATLTMRHAGRERLVYGRPRRFVPNLDDLADGYATILCDFVASETTFLDSAVSSVTAQIVPKSGGGLLAPLASPLMTTLSSDRSIAADVGGTVAAWPTVTITGPITNPVVEAIGAWRMEFLTTLAAGQTIVVDTRPHARTIKRNGASTPGLIRRTSTRLSGASLPPGRTEFAFRGTSETGTATLRLSWRDTYPTP